MKCLWKYRQITYFKFIEKYLQKVWKDLDGLLMETSHWFGNIDTLQGRIIQWANEFKYVLSHNLKH